MILVFQRRQHVMIFDSMTCDGRLEIVVRIFSCAEIFDFVINDVYRHLSILRS